MTARDAFWRGFRDCSPFILIVVPYAMLFGVVARAAGLDILQAMSMSVLVIAGASQLTAVSLLQENVPLLVALFTALAVNLRMAMYSAALVPHLGHTSLRMRMLIAYFMVDQAFAVAVKTYEETPQMKPDAKVAYYFGAMLLICPFWYGSSLLGAVLGTSVPASLSLDFAAPVCFIALIAPMLRSLPFIGAATIAALCSLLLAGLPWSLGIVVSGLIGIISGAQIELYLKRRAAGGSV